MRTVAQATEVAVTNVGAGHAIPTSITELRQVWIDLAVRNAGGKEIFRSGAVEDSGEVDRNAVTYHAVLLDEEEEVTLKPWRAVEMLAEKLIPPKETVLERYSFRLPVTSPAVAAVVEVGQDRVTGPAVGRRGVRRPRR